MNPAPYMLTEQAHSKDTRLTLQNFQSAGVMEYYNHLIPHRKALYLANGTSTLEVEGN